ncbi:MAG: substrate-binding domain-containing protein [Eubacterium sp.]
MKQFKISQIGLFICLIAFVLLSGCRTEEPKKQGTADGIQIGFSFDSLVIERWQRDRDVFVSQAQQLGAKVNVQNAGGDVATQKKQITYFMEQKMDVIVVVAVDTSAFSDVVSQAKKQGIRVVAYDRMLENANVDLYLSFDSEKVGEIYGDAILEKFPKGARILEVLGSPDDYNVRLMEKGLAVKLDDMYKVVEKKYASGWIAEQAYDVVSEYFSRGGSCDVVLCGNDDLATQAILALSENRKAGKVYVLGQDGDLAACQRIVEGTQAGTAFKNIDELAKTAAELCVKLAKGEETGVTQTISDGTYSVPSYQLLPIFVNRKNVDQVIIEGGFHTKEEVYLNKKDR